MEREMNLTEWLTEKLEAAKDCERIVVTDPLHIIPEGERALSEFALRNGFIVICAPTNLIFRDLYRKALQDENFRKLILVDQSPRERLTKASTYKAPPLFYPDILNNIQEKAKISVDLQQYLIDVTRDSNWPMEVNDRRFARLMIRNLNAIVRAHSNLRAINAQRFTDKDLRAIVAFASLGIPEAAFKKPDAREYWKICLLGHDALEELNSLAPEITQPVKEGLQGAPAPFCWFSSHDVETVLRAFYLSVIFAQHSDTWELLLSKIDPGLLLSP